MAKKKWQRKESRFYLHLVNPFHLMATRNVGATDNKQYAYRRARQLSREYGEHLYVRVMDMESRELTVYHCGEEIKYTFE